MGHTNPHPSREVHLERDSSPKPTPYTGTALRNTRGRRVTSAQLANVSFAERISQRTFFFVTKRLPRLTDNLQQIRHLLT